MGSTSSDQSKRQAKRLPYVEAPHPDSRMINSMPHTWYERFDELAPGGMAGALLCMVLFAVSVLILVYLPGHEKFHSMPTHGQARLYAWAGVLIFAFPTFLALIPTIGMILGHRYRLRREIASWASAGMYRERFPPPGEDLSKMKMISEVRAHQIWKEARGN